MNVLELEGPLRSPRRGGLNGREATSVLLFELTKISALHNTKHWLF